MSSRENRRRRRRRWPADPWETHQIPPTEETRIDYRLDGTVSQQNGE